MKKLFVFLLALTVIGTTVFAEDAKTTSPTAKYGVSGSFEMDVLNAAKTSTYDGDYQAKNAVAKDNPKGLQVTAFNVNPWLSLDWAKVSFKAEAKYNGFDADDTDYSSIKLTTIVKDIYGIELKSEVTADNKRSGNDNYKKNATENPPDVALGTLDNNLFATYKTDGMTFYAKYGFTTGATTRSASVLEPLDFVANFTDQFKEIGWTMDTEGLGGALVLENYSNKTYYREATAADFGGDAAAAALAEYVASGATITRANVIKDAWLEARNMFGVWTSKVNGGEIKLRQANLDLDISEDRGDVSDEFGIDKDVAIYATFKKTDDGDAIDPAFDPILDSERGTNFLNTIKLGDALTLKVGTVVPYAGVAFVDWLKGENMSVGVDYALAGVGKVSAGALVSMDYTTLFSDAAMAIIGTLAVGPNPVYLEGDSIKLGHYLDYLVAYDADPLTQYTNSIDEGTGFWFDATVTELVPALKLFASVDGRFGSYVDAKKYIADVTAGKGSAANNVLTIENVPVTMVNLGLEAAYTVMDPLTVSAAFYTGLALGYDYETYTGAKFAKPYANMSGGWTADDQAVLDTGAKSMILKVRADYMVNDMVSVWGANSFTANSGVIVDGALDKDLLDSDNVAKQFTVTTADPIFGFYSKNAIEAGAKLTASKNASLTVSGEYDLYLVPELTYKTSGATSDQKTAEQKAYDQFLADNLSPFSVSVAFSYKY